MLHSWAIHQENTTGIMKYTSQSFLEIIEVVWFHQKEIAAICNPHYSAIRVAVDRIFLPFFYFLIEIKSSEELQL